MKNVRHGLIVLTIITTTLILLTWSISLTHNMNLHPDESVFYKVAGSLSSFLLGSVAFKFFSLLN